ncbi:MAG: ATPase, T2SS/T4P/T4SS family [Oscillospiraceae bacterium]
MDMKYLEAIRSLTKNLTSMLSGFPTELQGFAREVSIRTDKPIVVSTFSGEYFLKKDGGFSKFMPITPYIVTREELFECVRVLTEYSLHSYKSEINSGFITIKGGHRAGVCGSCVYENGEIITVNNISSINLRIARQVKGVATSLVKNIYRDSISSTIIAGPPASGKTTMLKDIARCMSNGTLNYNTKLCIIDERGEIAAVYRGTPQNDVGIMTDVFDGYKKGDGMEAAIRSMSPKVIILDEISGLDDVSKIKQSLNAGVAVIATVHAQSIDELFRKKYICEMLNEGNFKHIVLLNDAQNPCTIKEIVSPKELLLCQ